VLASTFAPSFLTGRWSHPAFGYLVAVLLQAAAVAGTALLVQLVPSFHFIAAPLILVVLLLALAMSPSVELAIAHREDVLDILMYLVIGATSSLLAGAVASAHERAVTHSERRSEHASISTTCSCRRLPPLCCCVSRSIVWNSSIH
jgi:hypothetical protein